MSCAAVLLATCAAAILPADLAAIRIAAIDEGGYGRDPATETAAVVPLAEEAIYASPTRRDRIGRILAPVMINGQGPFRFVVDTGATHSVMAAHLVRHLGLVATEGSGVLLSGVTGSIVVATVQVDQLQAGELIMRDRAMAVINARLSDEDGVLGVEGLQQKKIVVDFGRNQIQILESHEARTPGEYVRIPVQLDFKGLMLVNARIGRLRVKAIIDTGAERTLGNSALQRALKIGDNTHNAPPTTGVQGVTAEIQPAYLLTAPTIKLGDMYIAQVDVSFGDIHVFKVWNMESEPALLIGMDVLGVLDTIIIDYGRKQLLLKARSTSSLRMQMVR